MQALTTVIRVKDAQGRLVEEKEVATYAGVLARAHEEGLSSITTLLVQVPCPDNGMVAIVTAQVMTSKGTFAGIGDANEGNVGRKIVPHLIRMAETRAKVRAMRDAVNIGTVALEELGNLADDEPTPAPRRDDRGQPPRDNVRQLPVRQPAPQDRPRTDQRPQERQVERAPATAPRPADRQPDRPAPSNGRPTPMTENQRRLLYRMLADQGFEGQAATRALMHAAQVNDLRDISKDDASALIDAWKNQQQAANG